MPDYLADDYSGIAKRMRELNLNTDAPTQWGLWYDSEKKWCWITSDGRIRACRVDDKPTLFSSEGDARHTIKNGGGSSSVVPKLYQPVS